MLEFDAGVAGGELPVDLALVSVGGVGPGFEFCVEDVDVGDASAEVLPGQAGQFDLGDATPTAVLGGVVDLQSAGQGEGLLRESPRLPGAQQSLPSPGVTPPKRPWAPFRLCRNAMDLTVGPCPYAIGADRAKEKDTTVIVVARVDETPWRNAYLRAVNRKPWPHIAGRARTELLDEHTNAVEKRKYQLPANTPASDAHKGHHRGGGGRPWEVEQPPIR